MDEVKLTKVACAVALLLTSSACVEVGIPADGNKTHGTFVPLFQMHDDPAFEDQQAQDVIANRTDRMRYPAPETVPRNFRRTAASADTDAAETLANPVPVSEGTLRYGRIKYEKTCATCHGDTGQGDGTIAGPNKIQAIPSLSSARARGYSDGRLYRIISHGMGRMWSYKSQLQPMERWAVVNYVRVIQRAKNPEPWDYTEE
jgi:mono/diheme cytochrome c family protein